jgi:hypothetical protein
MDSEYQHHDRVGTPEHFELELGVEAERMLSPGEVRDTILAQHDRIRGLLSAIEDKAIRLLASPVPIVREREQTRELALHLCSVMTTHIALEDRILVRVLTEIDAWGLVRAERLRQEHAEQLLLVQAYARELEAESVTGTSLAMTATALVTLVSADMEHEESTVLHTSLLLDDASAYDVESG